MPPGSDRDRQASIRDLIKKRNCYYPSEGSDPIRVLAAGVGHRPRMLLTGYAIDTALPSRLQAELLDKRIRYIAYMLNPLSVSFICRR